MTRNERNAGSAPRSGLGDFRVFDKAYLSWLRANGPVVRPDLRRRDGLLAGDDLHAFLRTTFPRWAYRFPRVCPAQAAAPLVLGVGDVHVMNFGVWLSGPDVCFGVNDFDEAAALPYTNDLVRLLTSALLADRALSAAKAAEAVLQGYDRGLDGGTGSDGVLRPDEHATVLRLARRSLPAPDRFWNDLKKSLSRVDEQAPGFCEALLDARASVPRGATHIKAHRRTAGSGSLGRVRVLVQAERRGLPLAREAKRLLPSAWDWARTGLPTAAAAPCGNVHYRALLEGAPHHNGTRVSDDGRCVIRCLSPEQGRLSIIAGEQTSDEKHEVLRAMGRAVGLVHGLSGASDWIRLDLGPRARLGSSAPAGLADAALTMRRDVELDAAAARPAHG